MRKIIGFVLLAAGVLVLLYRGFDTTTHHKTDLKVVQFDLAEKEHHEIPAWVGIVLVAAGAGALAMPSRKS